jgi:CheY-like chemotaxis protein
VEDNQDAADSLQLLLELWGYEVRVAYTGPDGVTLAEGWLPDVVLSDLGLPGLDGFGVARHLRQNPATAKVRLLAITGYSGEEVRRRARESGFDQILTKPANPEEVLRLLATPA